MLSIALAGAALFTALGGTAVAAKGLVNAAQIGTGAVTSKKIKNGTIQPEDMNATTLESLHGTDGVAGAKGDTGLTGSTGTAGTPGLAGTSGVNGANGPNGANGANGVDGDDGAAGIDGTDGTDGADGADGVLGPLSATAGTTALPTASPPTVVISMNVPAGNYVVFAKTQLSHTGAGDSVDCVLKAGNTTVDQVSMKTLPALAAIPASLQAVTTTSPTQLSVECDVLTANGSAAFNSLIAIPTA